MTPVYQRVIVGAALLLLAQTASVGEWESGVSDEGNKVQTLKIQAPTMTEEDQYGYTMPDQYRCDSCKAVAYHLEEAMRKRELKNRRLTEWELQELFDDTCKTGFAGYGLSHVNGESVLSGPGLKRDDLEPGMGAIQMGGETWEKRLGEVCRKFVYDKVGEDELYEHFRKHGKVSHDLCFEETRDCRRAKLGPQPPSVDGVVEQKRLQDEEKKKKKNKKSAKDGSVIELSNFMAKLAVKHGLAKTDYTRKRTFQEWEKLLLEAADRISKDQTKANEVVREV